MKLSDFIVASDGTKLESGIDIQEVKEQLFSNLLSLKKMENKEYLLHRKYFELKALYNQIKGYEIAGYPNKLMSFRDLEHFMETDNNKVEIRFCESNRDSLDWKIGRCFISSMTFDQNPGRNLRFLILINDKIAGFICIASDFIAMKCRDTYIGWTTDMKIKGPKLLNNSAVGSTIVPVQPFGYFTTGGKLLCLLLHHKIFQDIWKRKYNDTLVGLTTTSLYGINSQYLGFPKYWKACGETDGEMLLFPDENVIEQIRKWLKQNHEQQFIESQQKTGPKQRYMNLFYQKSKFSDMWKERTGKTLKSLKHNFKRGGFYARFYDNSLEFLRNEIKENQLIPRSNLDFDINNINEIVAYWKRKFANRRWQKKKNETNRKKLFMGLEGIKNIEQFTKRWNR